MPIPAAQALQAVKDPDRLERFEKEESLDPSWDESEVGLDAL